MQGHFLFPLLITLLVAPAHALSSEPCIEEQAARDKAKGLVRSYIGEEDRFVDAIRREDLENQFFEDQVKVKGRIAKETYFYELNLSGTSIVSPDEVVTVVTLDWYPMWIVAVARCSGNAYGLAGFKDAESAFNRLLDEVPVATTTPPFWAAGFLELTTDTRYGRVVSSFLQVKQAVESHFYSEYSPDKSSRDLFNRWWRRNGKQVEKTNYKARSEPAAGSAVVRLLRIRLSHRPLPTSDWLSPIPEPILEEVAIEVQPDGKCTIVGVKKLIGS